MKITISFGAEKLEIHVDAGIVQKFMKNTYLEKTMHVLKKLTHLLIRIFRNCLYSIL